MNALAPAPEPAPSAANEPLFEVENLNFNYGAHSALQDINLNLPQREITAFIGPSGCGKSTLLRCFNRMNEHLPGAHIRSGSVRLQGKDINHPTVNPVQLRRKVGMVFQRSNPFPRSIFENVAYGLHLHTRASSEQVQTKVEETLRAVALWDEVKDRLNKSANDLSGGQQQRLCIARALAVDPTALLMDEPCSALDPIATAHIEELILQLAEKITIIIVTHNMHQALRVADTTAYFHSGRLIEKGETMALFENPQQDLTRQFVTGRMG